jgi:hypothetical protein
MNPNILKSPIFVVGPSRSGTTWVKCLLASHDEFFTIPEIKLYQNVLNPKKKIGYQDSYPTEHTEVSKKIDLKLLDLAIKRLIELNILTHSDKLIGEIYEKCKGTDLSRAELFCDIIYYLKSKHNLSGNTLVEGTPRHILFAIEILEDFPDAKFIVMERDTVDVAISAKYTYNNPFFSGLEDAYTLKTRCDSFINNYKDKIITVVNYSVLKRNPGIVINAIFNDLGFSPVDETTLTTNASQIYHKMVTDYGINANHQPQMNRISTPKVFPKYTGALIEYFKLKYSVRELINYLLHK